MSDNATTGTMSDRTGSSWSPENGGLPANSEQGGVAGAASSLAHTAQEYAGKVSDVAVQAKDFVTDKVNVVSDKIKDIDFSELAGNAKEYARQKPGQAILISAGIGLLLGLLVRGRR